MQNKFKKIKKEFPNIIPKDNLYIQVKVITRASKNEILWIMSDNQTWKIKIKAVPENWKANLEIQKFLSKIFKINKNNIEIISWATSSRKLIRILHKNKLSN